MFYSKRIFILVGPSPRPVGRLPLPKSSVSPKSYSPSSPIGPNFPKSGPSSPNSSGLPSPTPNSQLPLTTNKEQKAAPSIQNLQVGSIRPVGCWRKSPGWYSDLELQYCQQSWHAGDCFFSQQYGTKKVFLMFITNSPFESKIYINRESLH